MGYRAYIQAYGKKVKSSQKQKKDNSVLKKLSIVIFFLCLFFSPGISNAQEIPKPGQIDGYTFREIDQDIKEILESSEFDQWEKQETWKWKWQPNQEDSEENQDSIILSKIASIIASILPWILILSLLVLIIYVIVIKKDAIIRLFKLPWSQTAKIKIRQLKGKVLIRSKLPAEIILAAKQYWKKGKPKQALSLIYRGVLLYFYEKRHIVIPDSATEDECYQKVKAELFDGGSLNKLLKDFFHLIQTWQQSAYANRHPDNLSFDSLCHRWDTYFGIPEKEKIE